MFELVMYAYLTFAGDDEVKALIRAEPRFYDTAQECVAAIPGVIATLSIDAQRIVNTRRQNASTVFDGGCKRHDSREVSRRFLTPA